ncbi:MAG: serine hydrolase [Candidatus Kapabacteria bacterium]|nr:serine hydrolase [Candidatus Kapabacteria bacterium]
MNMHVCKGLCGIATAALTLLFSSVTMQADDAAMKRRLDDVCRIISGSPVVYESTFTAQFLKQVPAAKLSMLVGQLTSQTGPCNGIRITERRSAYQVAAEASTTNGFSIPVLLTIEAQAPYLIAGFFLRPPVKAVGTLDSLVGSLKDLEGSVAFTVTNLSGGSVVTSIGSSEHLPVGSTFKLYVLGELVRSIGRGERAWTDILRIDSAFRSLPSGRLHTWPHRSPLTLHSLAAMMISESDNTATDALIRLLGPDKIAQQMSAMGHDRPDLNVPFLTTLQAFKLKYAPGGLAAAFVSKSVEERRSMLAQIDTAVTHDSIAFTMEPTALETIEWFATTSELTRAMDWLRRDAMMRKDDSGLEILSINSGVPVGKSWKRVCFKGGSEPGTINLTYLLEHANGTWYAVSGTWFNKRGAVDEARFAGLMERAITLLEK